MIKKSPRGSVFSRQTRNNFLLDMLLLTAGLASALSGIYFLFLPVGGFRGGRNPLYGVTILFERHAWGDIHTWASVIIIALAALHIPLHWDWIVKMSRSGFRSLLGKNKLNQYSQFNLGVNILIGLCGLICGLSGMYFLLAPESTGSALAGAPILIFSPVVWDMIHTWSGVVMIAAAILHIAIHWKWVLKIVGKYWKTLAESQEKKRAGTGSSLPAVQPE